MKKTCKINSLLLAAVILICGILAVYPEISGSRIAEAAIKMNINRSSLSLQQDDTATLKITVTKAAVKWSSSNKKVATVSSKGVVTAREFGKATITARVDGKKFTCAVTVEPLTEDPDFDYSYYSPYVKSAKYQKWLTDSIKKLTDEGYKASDSTGLMFLNRYNYYLKQIRNNKAFIGYNGARCSEIYLYYAFYRMMRKDVVDKITENTLNGKEAFDGFTGLFERPYYSEYDGKLDSYIIYLPKDYDPSKSYPLVVLLHGHGGCCYIERVASEDDKLMKNCEEKDVILVCPNGRHVLPKENASYKEQGEQDVLQVIKDVESYYRIDKSRIYLTGFSMGGMGTWYIGSRNADLFAAIAPLCGYGDRGIILEQLKEVPVLAYYGDMDPGFAASRTTEMIEELQAMDADVTYIELKGYDHNIWDYVYEQTDILDWLLQFKK